MLCIQQAILNNSGIWEVPKLALRKHLVAELEQRTNDSCRSPKTSSPCNLITVRAAVAGSPRCLLAIGPLRHTAPTSPAATICIWPVSTNMFHLLSQNIYFCPRSGSWRLTGFSVTIISHDWLNGFIYLFQSLLFDCSCLQKNQTCLLLFLVQVMFPGCHTVCPHVERRSLKERGCRLVDSKVKTRNKPTWFLSCWLEMASAGNQFQDESRLKVCKMSPRWNLPFITQTGSYNKHWEDISRGFKWNSKQLKNPLDQFELKIHHTKIEHK